MSKRDFEAIAAALWRITSRGERRRAADALIPVFVSSNPRFDSVRFLRACGFEPGDDGREGNTIEAPDGR